MKVTRSLKFTAEKYELTVIRYGQTKKMFCHFCQSERQHSTVSETAQVLNLSEREVFRLVESEQIHSVETVDGKLFICGDSVECFLKKNSNDIS